MKVVMKLKLTRFRNILRKFDLAFRGHFERNFKFSPDRVVVRRAFSINYKNAIGSWRARGLQSYREIER